MTLAVIDFRPDSKKIERFSPDCNGYTWRSKALQALSKGRYRWSGTQLAISACRLASQDSSEKAGNSY